MVAANSQGTVKVSVLLVLPKIKICHFIINQWKVKPNDF